MSIRSKKELLRSSRLCAVIDREVCAGRSLLDVAVEAVRGGAELVQLRDKVSSPRAVFETAIAIRKALLPWEALFIVNDYLDIARIVDSDGVHLGQSDGSLLLARAVLGRNKMIGISCRSYREALAAEQGGADYIGFGALFPTSTKSSAIPLGTGVLTTIGKKLRIPLFAIGGIDSVTLPHVRRAGINRVAVCSAICRAASPRRAAYHLRRALN